MNDIINELTSKRQDLLALATRSADSASDVGRGLRYSWSALNRYIESTMSAMGSLHVPNFLTIGWIEAFDVVDSKFSPCKKLRPCFYLANTFSQSFGLGDRVRNLLCHRAHADLKSVANFSFSTAALRFSDGLTKDEVFTSLRAIIQSIGDHASKHAVRIEFSVGTLYLGKHRNQFTFNKRLRGLIDPGSCDIDDYTEVSSEIHPDDSVSVISSNRHSRKPSSVSVAMSQARSSSETPPDLPLISSANRKDFAYKAALGRHLSDLEVRASEAVRSRKQWEEQVKSSKLLSELEMESRRKRERENAQFLLQQITDSSSRKQSQRKEEIEETNRLVGFPRFTESPESEMKNQLKTSGEQIRSDLDNQVLAMKSLRTAAYARDKEIATKLNESSRQELEELRRSENTKKNVERDILRDSWNRDIQIKNCWKNIEQFDMMPEKFCSSNVGVLLPRVSDDETRSQILGGSARRSLTGSVRKR